MPLRTMLTQHILDKPLTPYAILHTQYFAYTKCSYEGLNRTWKNRGCWKEAPKNALTMSSELLASSLRTVSICNPLVANAFHGRESRHMHTEECRKRCMIKRWQRWMCLCKGFSLLFVTSKGFQRQAFQVLVEWQSISQRQHLIGRKAFQLQVLTHRHLFEEYLFLQTDDAFRIGSVSKDRLFHFGAEVFRGHRDPAIQAAAIIHSIDSLVLEIHCPQ